MSPYGFSDSPILQGLISRRTAGDETGLSAHEIVERFTGGHAGEISAMELRGLIERIGAPSERPVLYRASAEAIELSKGPDRPQRRYGYVLVAIDDEVDAPFDALADAVNSVAGCSTLSTCVPPLKQPASVAEGWMNTIIDAHELDEEDEHAERLVAEATAAITALIEGPRRSL